MRTVSYAMYLSLGLALTLVAVADDPTEDLLRSDSRAPYVHRITIYDHDGAIIDPTDPLAGPYSPQATCAKCHPYSQIAHGWHFNANDPNVVSGPAWQPWFIVEEHERTQTPISGRDWRGALDPSAAGLSHWDFVMRFGHHLPGGGYGEPPDEVIQHSDKFLRWGISGRLEVDCLFCHCTDQGHNPAEAATQIEAQNFKWLPTATFGLASIRGEARTAPDDWDPMMPPDPDFPERSGPQLTWDERRFDPDGRVLFSVTRRVPNERCYFCHSFRQVGPGARADLARTEDVHLAAGLLCVDCHRNGLDHMIVRGYRTEALDRLDVTVAMYSCEGCHLGIPGADDPELVRGGHYGAPYPQHRGFPPLHFEKLTCTACHAGPWPGAHPQRFQTALAHRLGLATRDRTELTPPYIAGPLFTRQHDGKIAPQMIAWNHWPTDEETGDDDKPAAASDVESATYTWSVGHNVRPARLSLGIGGCTDCHVQGIMYFGRTGSADGLVPAGAENMTALRGDSVPLALAWDAGFRFRPPFKYFAFTCAAIIFLILLRYGSHALPQAGARLRERDDEVAPREPHIPPARLGFADHLFHTIALLGILIQVATAMVLKLILGEFSGWLLFAHMFGAPLFILGLTGVAIMWARRAAAGQASGLTVGQRTMFWIALLLGFAVMMPMLSAMLPVFGTAGQHALIEFHETAALLLVVVMVIHTAVSLAARAARKRTG